MKELTASKVQALQDGLKRLENLAYGWDAAALNQLSELRDLSHDLRALLAAEQEKVKALEAELDEWRTRFALRKSGGWQTAEEAAQSHEGVYKATCKVISTIRQEKEAAEARLSLFGGQIAELDALLKAGGICDLPFHIGQVSALLERRTAPQSREDPAPYL